MYLVGLYRRPLLRTNITWAADGTLFFSCMAHVCNVSPHSSPPAAKTACGHERTLREERDHTELLVTGWGRPRGATRITRPVATR